MLTRKLGLEIRLVLDQLGPVAALEEVPAMAVATSPPIGVRREEQLHALGEVGARRLEDQVEVDWSRRQRHTATIPTA